MFRREDRSGNFFQDDNKYAKTPFSIHTKPQSRRRLRKRHAVLVLCLLAASYMFFKSPSTSVSLSPRPSPIVPKAGTGQGHIEKKLAPPVVPNVNNNAGVDAKAKEPKVNESARQEDKKKKKKKKPWASLFDFEDKKEDKSKKNKSKNNNNNNKNKNNNKDQQAPPAQVVSPPAPAIPVTKQQHNKDEHMDENHQQGDTTPKTPSNGPRINAPIWEERKERVKQAFLHSWNAYRRDAWGKDEYHPISKYGSNMIRGGQGFTIVDSLDTILLMGLETEFQEAKTWVKNELDFDTDGEINLFETTIRVLGGLLSAYDQSGQDPVFLHKAVDLADRLMGGFDTVSGIPYASVHLKERRGVPGHDRGISSTSEVSSLQLEFKYLSFLTGDAKYWKAAENVILKMRELDDLDGLVPVYINPYTGNYQGGEIRLGSRGDSYYEYLIKQYLQTGKQEKVYKDMYDRAIGGVKKHLLGRTIPNNLLFVGEISKYEPSNLSSKMDHLVCFLGGTMALASTEGHVFNQTFVRSHLSTVQEQDFKIGEELTESCYQMYHQTETGLAPEIVHWVQNKEQIRGRSALQHTPNSDFIINDRDGHNLLRPETVESLFYMWRLTGDEKYRNWGWSIFEAIEKYSKVSTGGYSSIHDIRRANNIQFSDKLETFFLSETLKYFYLLFGSDDILPLDKYVFNTEGHPLPVFTPPKELLTRTSSLSTSPSNRPDAQEEGSAPLSEEEKRFKELISKEDGYGTDADEDGDDEEEARDGGIGVEDMEDDAAGTDDSLASAHNDEDEKNNDNQDQEPNADEDMDNEADEVDQGLEDMALDTGEDEDEEVPEVEVDYEENDNEAEQDENEDEDEDGGDDENEDEDGENGENEDEDGENEDADADEDGKEDEDADTEQNEEEEEDEEEEDEEEEDEDDEQEEEDEDDDDEDLEDGGGEGYGVVNPADWENEDDEDGEGGEGYGVVNPADWEDENDDEQQQEEEKRDHHDLL
ncbi:mannosyl-oligosaccharide alpha-1,2-mannosidase [Haplosporangium sp. Z 11]|nr:mannosyl-oligosaccharide alpha-1,2-mannosidase [Haplosporangium sp. Z 11]